MKLILTLICAATGAACACAAANGTVSLDSCRTLALTNNKQLMMTRTAITKAGYQKKEAFAAYLPALDFAGGYAYNQKGLAVFSKDQLLPVKTFDPAKGGYEFDLVTNPATGQPVKGPDGQYIPSQVALIPKESMEFDTRNVFFGAVTLTQPLYMGGKIQAMNAITGYAEKLAHAMHVSEAQNVVYAVDAAYWQVVSLAAKQRLARSYVNLLDSLDHNVALMLGQGVATRADLLAVDVKLNEARVDLTKVDNGLVLSRMALAQVCGLPLNTVMTLQDEESDNLDVRHPALTPVTMDEALNRRQDLHALQLGAEIAGQQAKVARADMLPKIALTAAYSFSNPNMFDGFRRRFDGMFSVGAVLTVPIWHWGGNYNKYRAAKTDETLMKLKLEDARQMADLQITQAQYRAQESLKTYNMTRSNLASADENLRSATLGFKEGVMTSDDVMAAQTAWLKANSQNIDAMIDIQLCNTYLAKCLGTLDTSVN